MADGGFAKKVLADALLTRRSFVKWSAAVGGTAALSGGGAKYGLQWAAQTDAATDATVIPTGCAHNCGGRCVLKAWVQDGSITRITSDDRPDSFEDPQLRACMRGRSYRRRVYHPDRLKYPMKRVGERGEGKFERVSWDEALDTVASEMQRIKDEYGNEALLNHYASGGGSALRGAGASGRLMNLFGGSLNYYNSYSTACTGYATPYTLGTSLSGHSRDDLSNSKLILAWGWNPTETIFGTNTQYYLKEARKAGAKVIVIDPRMSMTASGAADEWIPIYPGTDNALMDAMAYVMITEGLHDQEFLDTYAVGFDEDHMPDGVPAGNSYKSYVMGDADGTAKTPEWAEAITRIPRDRIVSLAREFATTKPAALVQGWGMQRRAYGEQPVRGGINLAAMTGNIGISGGWGSGAGYCGRGTAVGGLPGGENPVEAAIPVFLWTEAILRGTELTAEEGLVGTDGLSSNLKLIYNCGGNTLINQHSNINRTAEILRDTSLVEFIVVHEHFMTPSAKFADILLPAATQMEQDDLCTTWVWGDSLIAINKAIEPLFESKTDYEICAEVAERLGIGEEYTEGGKSHEDWLREMVAVTEEAHPDFPGYEAWRAEGVFVPVYDEPHIAYKEFREDPEGNPLETPSGKIEIFSKDLWDQDIENMPAIAKYIPEWEGGPWDELYDQYPLSCMGSHYQRRSHSTYDNIDWMDEALPQRLFMNPIDAKARGLEDGDTVRVFNDRGEVNVPVRLTERIVPGVVDLPQGGWWDPDENGVDQRGSINVLTTERWTPGAKGNPQHTNLVEVEKAS